MKNKPVRPIKVIMRAELIDRVDTALQRGLGGFRTRQALFEEAVDYYLHELEDAALTTAAEGREDVAEVAIDASKMEQQRDENENSNSNSNQDPSPRRHSQPTQSFNDFAIQRVDGFATVEQSESVAVVSNEPILGLHNRDWPSLQAISVLARMSAKGTVPTDRYYAKATADAWKLAGRLDLLERSGVGKPTALLPSNRAKPRAAEAYYRNFALGWIGKGTNDKSVEASGPLFVWGAAGLVWHEGELHIGLTDAGLDFLSCAEGLTPQGPHNHSAALEFMRLLIKHAPPDAVFFRYVLSEIADCPARLDLVERIKVRQSASNSVAASLAQGYIARGREWGIVEPKQTDGKYVLTDFGEDLVEKLLADKESTFQEAAK